jgi:hypothetical protein
MPPGVAKLKLHPWLGLVVLSSAALLLAVGGPSLLAADPSAAGLWEQVDPRTKQPEAWFRIIEKDGTYEAILVRVFFKPGEDPNFVCDKCKGDEKGRLLGLALVSGMRRNGLMYENGTVLDVRDGASYPAIVRLSPDGQRLAVRAIVGIPEPWGWATWNRLPDDTPAAPPGFGPEKQ